MLREVITENSVLNGGKRRWFECPGYDLLVWYGDAKSIGAFQLCYEIHHQEHALSWKSGLGFRHEIVDDGESRPMKHKSSPVLMPDGDFDAEQVRKEFSQISRSIDPVVASFVLCCLDSGNKPSKG